VWELCDRERASHHSLDGYAELHQEVGLEGNTLNEKPIKMNKVILVFKGKQISFECLGNYHKRKSVQKISSKEDSIISLFYSLIIVFIKGRMCQHDKFLTHHENFRHAF
jgi:hypothetical protein